MKTLLAICMILAAPFVWAMENPNASQDAGSVVTGEVLEVKDVETYTYLRLKTKSGETWAAVNKTPVRKGERVTIANVMEMTNFHSKSLNKTFPTILFGTMGMAGGGMMGASHDISTAHSGLAKSTGADDVHVPKASGAYARTVAEVIMNSAGLKDKPVLVHGKVVKYNPGIMGKNWAHLRDGTGSAAAGTNDVLVTTTNQTKAGDVVTVKGIVRTNKDFGSGYSYKVLIEDATLLP